MSSKKCYNWDASAKKPALSDPNFDQPCPSGGGCCNPGDTCVGNFMCKHKETPTDPNKPEYYISACTDPNYTSVACTRWCAQFIRTGVVYDSASDRWLCCGTADPPKNLTTTCATPSNVSFALVPPDQLPIIGIAGGALPSPSSSTPPASSPTTTSSDTSGPNSSSSGLSTAAKVGLGVGLGVTFALIIAALLFIFSRRRRRSRTAASRSASESPVMGLKSHFGLPKWQNREAWGTSISHEKNVNGTVTNMTELPTVGHGHLELPAISGNPRAELPS